VPHAIDKWLPVLRQAMVITRRAISPHAITKWATRPSALSARLSAVASHRTGTAQSWLAPQLPDHAELGAAKNGCKIPIQQTAKGSTVMHRPSNNERSQVTVFSTPSPALTSLTGRSTRTPILARASIGALRASRYGAG